MEQKNQTKTIGVFFGSGSPEHDVSIITAQLIISGLKGLEYNVVPVYISKQGKWMLGEELGNLKYFVDNRFNIQVLFVQTLNFSCSVIIKSSLPYFWS